VLKFLCLIVITSILKIPIDGINKIKSVNAVKPNIIHSLDAEHLNLVVQTLLTKDIMIATILDCYRIYPNNYYIVKAVTIQEFLDLYSQKSFLLQYHNMCLEKINFNYTIISVDGNSVILETCDIIPAYEFERQPNFIEFINSNYHIK
jgi:hypothetical protein